MTDPARIADPLTLLRALPQAADGRIGVIYRHFGAANRHAQARALAALCRRRRFVFLIGADAALAAKVRADGIHLPERFAGKADGIKRHHPHWFVTLAAHDRRTLPAARGLDAVLISPVFETQSAGAKGRKRLGRRGLSGFARHTRAPIYALGGVSAQNMRKIEGIKGVTGIALASGLIKSR